MNRIMWFWITPILSREFDVKEATFKAIQDNWNKVGFVNFGFNRLWTVGSCFY